MRCQKYPQGKNSLKGQRKGPILRGRDIKRYGYEFADQYIIATFPSRKYNIDDYPAIRDHLFQYGKKDLSNPGNRGQERRLVINGLKHKTR
jgi:hypothetical protein